MIISIFSNFSQNIKSLIRPNSQKKAKPQDIKFKTLF